MRIHGDCIPGSGVPLISKGVLSRRARAPPWRAAAPSLAPPAPWSLDSARQIAPPPRIGFLGRSLTGSGGPYATVYLDALLDQVVLATSRGGPTAPSQLSARRSGSGPTAAAAWRLESLRRSRSRHRGRGAPALLAGVRSKPSADQRGAGAFRSGLRRGASCAGAARLRRRRLPGHRLQRGPVRHPRPNGPPP